MHHEAIPQAEPGTNIGFQVHGVTTKDIKRGDVVGQTDRDPPAEAVSFEAQTIILNHPGKIMEGYTPIVDVHTTHVPCKFNKIQLVEKGKEVQAPRDPVYVKNGETAIIEMVPLKPLVVEKFSEYPPLGRFAVRDSKKTVAVGVIRNVVKKDASAAQKTFAAKKNKK